MRKSGAEQGRGGLKFGLIGPASKLKKAGGPSGTMRPRGAKPPPRKRPPCATAIFDAGNSDDDDSDGDDKGKRREDPSGVAAVNRRLAAISAKQEKAAQKEYEEALAADPSVFDYDRAYDGMQASREFKAMAVTTEREKDKRKPKYIGNLLKQAKLREVESDRIFERKLQNEREAQDKLEGEATMKFVTSAYKKKLMEQKKWELQQQLEEEREQREDVTKKGMSGFYSNLITKNIAMGGDVETSANSAFTTGSKRHAITDRYEMQDGNDKKRESASTEAEGSTCNGAQEDAYGDAYVPSARMVDPRAAAAAIQKFQPGEGVGTDEKDRTLPNLALVADEGAAARRAEVGGDGGKVNEGSGSEVGDVNLIGKERRRDDTEQSSNAMEDHGRGDRRNKRARTEGGEMAVEARDEEAAIEVSTSEADEKAAEESERVEKAAAAKAKKEAAVKAARERFLARKKS